MSQLTSTKSVGRNIRPGWERTRTFWDYDLHAPAKLPDSIGLYGQRLREERSLNFAAAGQVG
jgi:hypothetical protein